MDFKEYLKDDTINEASVQVQGDKKPSGALILAKVILEDLDKKGLLSGFDKPKQKNKLVQDIQVLIMNSTF